MLAGKYRVERVLGVGGMGVVVAATHLQLDQRVALKFLLPSALKSTEVVTRFAREARAAAKILSEHVARVIDVGTLESGSPFMVMEFLEGADLSDILRERGPLAAGDVAGYILQACEALAEAHAAGIVHRDLKPANIFLASRPGRSQIVKVLDFGISKTLAPIPGSDGDLTKTAALMGSPLYMSPEQLMSAKNVDIRCDVWALGVVMYELLSGKPPFDAETMPQIVTQILNVEPPPIGNGAPPDLEAIVRRCLAKDPSRRFPDVGALATALAPFADRRSAEVSVERISRVLGSGGPPSISKAAVLPRVVAETAAWAGTQNDRVPVRRNGMVVGIAIGALVVVGGGIGLYMAFGRSTTGTATSTAARTPTVGAPPVTSPASAAKVDLSLPPPPALEPLPEVKPDPSALATATAKTKPPAFPPPRATVAPPPATTVAAKPPPTVATTAAPPATTAPPQNTSTLHPGLER